MDNNSAADESLAGRVRRILDDMAFIRAAILAGDAQTGATPPPLELQTAARLKSGVDSMRQMLWLYMKARCLSSGAAPQQITDWYKLELMRMIRNRPTRAEVRDNVVEMIPSGSMPPAGQGDPHA